MNIDRESEQGSTPCSGRRLYSVSGQHSFDTRESEQFGPYRDQCEAKNALAIFIAQKLRGVNADRSDIGGIRNGAQEGIEGMVEELLNFYCFRYDKGQTAALAWANQRLNELAEYKKNIPNIKQRMEALHYVMDRE